MVDNNTNKRKDARSGVVLTIGMLVLISYLIWQRQELKKFRVTEYVTWSNKVNSDIKLVVIADLHSFSYGAGNERLLRAVREAAPDLILIPGDLIVSGKYRRYGVSLDFLAQLTTIAPVYLSNGNHESRAEEPDARCTEVFALYRKKVEELGVKLLNNKSCVATVRGNQLHIYGLEIPLTCYKKGKRPYLQPGYVKERLGEPDQTHLGILLAHNPAFAEQYADWGADLAFCGHNHGGLVYLPGLGSVLSPQLMFFPKYDVGEFDLDGHMVYISRGLGTHTFHIRIFNRAELMTVTVRAQSHKSTIIN